jgi:DNA gyrase subunit A
LLVSAKGMSVRFTADDDTLRPMGRATSGVIGMRFRAGDHLLAMDTVTPGSYVVTVTDGGFAKRTPVAEWTPKGRGIYGVRAMKLVEQRGSLVGALVAAEEDELYAIASDGVVIRTRVADIRATGRDTMGVSLMDVGDDNAIVSVARGEATDDSEDDVDLEAEGTESDAVEGDATAPADSADVAGTAESVTVIDDDDAETGDGPTVEG